MQREDHAKHQQVKHDNLRQAGAGRHVDARHGGNGAEVHSNAEHQGQNIRAPRGRSVAHGVGAGPIERTVGTCGVSHVGVSRRVLRAVRFSGVPSRCGR